MDLQQYKPIIDAMPVQKQAFYPNENSWGNILKNADIGLSLADFQYARGYSRIELHEMPLSPYKLIAILMWGYPTGGRGKNIENVLKRLDDICKTISFYENSDLTENALIRLITRLEQIPNLGRATWSKFLYFSHMTYKEKKMVILDSKISTLLNAQSVNGVVFKNLMAHNSAEDYCAYLLGMVSLSELLGSDIEKLEMFLFVFGSMLRLREDQ